MDHVQNSPPPHPPWGTILNMEKIVVQNNPPFFFSNTNTFISYFDWQTKYFLQLIFDSSNTFTSFFARVIKISNTNPRLSQPFTSDGYMLTTLMSTLCLTDDESAIF